MLCSRKNLLSLNNEVNINIMKHIFFIIFYIFISTYTIMSHSKLKYIDVEVTGFGSSEASAVKNALIEGLSQIEGQYMSATDKSEFKQKLDVIDGNETEVISEKFSEQVNSYTKGLIKKYKVVELKPKGSQFTAKVLMTIATYDDGIDAKKIKIAVLPFMANNDIDVQVATAEVDKWRRALVEGLVQTRKFQVIDKDYKDLINDELKSYNSKEYRIDELARFGKKIGADYVVSGTLVLGMKSKLNPDKQKYKLSLRIIDLATSQIKFAKQVSSPKKTIHQIIDAIYPIPVVNISDESVTIGIGGDILKVGDIYELVRLGQKLTDPYTGEKLGYQETTISDVEIEKVYAKTSKGKIIHEKVNLDEIQYKPGKFILRAIQINQGNKPPGEDILQSEDW